MTIFWLTAGALALASVAAMVLGAIRGPRALEAVGADIQVYRDQLAEVERDAARGMILPEEATRLRTEVSRRLLEADRAAQAAQAMGRGPGWAAVGAIVTLAVAGSIWLYQDRLGAPGYPDMPLAARLAQAEATRANRPGQALAEADMPAPATAAPVDAEFAALMDKLRSTVAARPDDMRGLELLAQNEARLGNFAAAHAAQTKLIATKGEAATAEDHAALAEMLILAAGGYISPEAEAALQAALTRDSQNGSARFYSGLMLIQTGRPDLAFPIWRELLEHSPPDAPWVAPIRRDIAELAQVAGVRYDPPQAAMPGPDAAAVEAASGMEDGDRQAMIESMVEQLNDRLAREGGSAAEWARLITSLGVLGQTDRARAIYHEAQTRFDGRAEDLAELAAAAQQAGVAE
ncbi:MAG TPA: c-type cytochrome biogenesis protein CcmI [Gemmobacter sp.]|nr:c-type cytochrome biogenesis protein CcmI [Gemmobacter sp.]